mmetsp:Transcript_6668/g.12818  ORF Transcript_6668/g.12818 Transcript_6668/m.12818 type:complete len:857 (+) Transcript_6668:287-2857(+)
MKRALAERAKQSIPERSPSATTSSPPEGQPPLKIARPSPSIVVSASASSRTPRSPKPVKTTSTKRPRETNGSNSKSSSQIHQDDESNVDETSAFYLKHQNRALAMELKGWQQQCRELTSERDQRRQSCWRAVQALQSLQATWTTLETALGQSQPGVAASSLTKTESSAPPSTALVMGRKNQEDEVEMEDPALAIEWTEALHESLHNLAFPKMEEKSESSATCDVGEDPHDVGALAANVASRASCLQDWLWKVLQAKRVSSDHLEKLLLNDNDAASERNRWQHQALEVTRSRDYWRSQERRIRRNLYRLEAGIVTLPHVMQSLERQDGTEDDDVANEDAKIRASVQLEKAAQAPPPEEKQEEGESAAVSSSVVNKMHQQIQQLEQEKRRREETIGELNQKLKDQGERINQLSAKQQSDEDAERLETLESTVSELKAAEEKVSALELELKMTKERWSKAQGNEAAALSSLDELRQKHEKRWNELCGADEGGVDGDSTDEQVTELRHKLQQALEHVRQAEDIRSNLAEALETNDKLTARLEEVKAAASDKEMPSSKDDKEESFNVSSASDRGGSDKSDKLYRDNRRMKEKIAQLMTRKENDKARIERMEKERDSLMDTNSRLLRQVSEKEEVNAKSLSSILHLKSMTEQLAEQRDNLEQQASSANQLALAARLASNAKDRVSDELSKEKKAIEERLEKSEKELNEVKAELAELKRDNSGKTSKHAALAQELANALKRCDELVAEGEAKREEIRRLVDSVDRAEREARVSKEKLETLTKNSEGGAVSEFTVEQLTTQVSVLKSRLACPVCHYRDKCCIITKCGHLHCKQCVDERISNRSRKCPTCNQMFSKTDVTDVFLE